MTNTMTNMWTLHDTFNDREISRHRTLQAAVDRQARELRAIQRRYGSNSYLPTEIRDADGERIPEHELPMPK